jgi:gluconate kinase
VTAGDRLTKGRTLWFTGLSGSGKSSIAVLVEQKLLEHGCPAYILDGDNLRHGLNADLGFSMADRAENLRRLAHIATLMADAGLTVMVPVISPLEEHRELARKVHADAGIEFFEVFVDTRSKTARSGTQGPVQEGPGRGDHPLHRYRQPLPASQESGPAADARTHAGRTGATGDRVAGARIGERSTNWRPAWPPRRESCCSGSARACRRHRRRAKSRRRQAFP